MRAVQLLVLKHASSQLSEWKVARELLCDRIHSHRHASTSGSNATNGSIRSIKSTITSIGKGGQVPPLPDPDPGLRHENGSALGPLATGRWTTGGIATSPCPPPPGGGERRHQEGRDPCPPPPPPPPGGGGRRPWSRSPALKFLSSHLEDGGHADGNFWHVAHNLLTREVREGGRGGVVISPYAAPGAGRAMLDLVNRLILLQHKSSTVDDISSHRTKPIERLLRQEIMALIPVLAMRLHDTTIRLMAREYPPDPQQPPYMQHQHHHQHYQQRSVGAEDREAALRYDSALAVLAAARSLGSVSGAAVGPRRLAKLYDRLVTSHSTDGGGSGGGGGGIKERIVSAIPEVSPHLRSIGEVARLLSCLSRLLREDRGRASDGRSPRSAVRAGIDTSQEDALQPLRRPPGKGASPRGVPHRPHPSGNSPGADIPPAVLYHGSEGHPVLRELCALALSKMPPKMTSMQQQEPMVSGVNDVSDKPSTFGGTAGRASSSSSGSGDDISSEGATPAVKGGGDADVAWILDLAAAHADAGVPELTGPLLTEASARLPSRLPFVDNETLTRLTEALAARRGHRQYQEGRRRELLVASDQRGRLPLHLMDPRALASVMAEAGSRAEAGASVKHVTLWALGLTAAVEVAPKPLLHVRDSEGLHSGGPTAFLPSEAQRDLLSPLSHLSPVSRHPIQSSTKSTGTTESTGSATGWKETLQGAASLLGNWFDFARAPLGVSAVPACSEDPSDPPPPPSPPTTEDLTSSAQGLLITAALRAGRLGAAWLDHRSTQDGSRSGSESRDIPFPPPAEAPLGCRPLIDLISRARGIKALSGAVGAALSDAARAAVAVRMTEGATDSMASDAIAEAAFALSGYMSDLDRADLVAHQNQPHLDVGGEEVRRLRSAIHEICLSAIRRRDLNLDPGIALRPPHQLQLFLALALLNGCGEAPPCKGISQLKQEADSFILGQGQDGTDFGPVLDLDPTAASLAIDLLPGLTRWFLPMASETNPIGPKPPFRVATLTTLPSEVQIASGGKEASRQIRPHIQPPLALDAINALSAFVKLGLPQTVPPSPDPAITFPAATSSSSASSSTDGLLSALQHRLLTPPTVRRLVPEQLLAVLRDLGKASLHPPPHLPPLHPNLQGPEGPPGGNPGSRPTATRLPPQHLLVNACRALMSKFTMAYDDDVGEGMMFPDSSRRRSLSLNGPPPQGDSSSPPLDLMRHLASGALLLHALGLRGQEPFHQVSLAAAEDPLGMLQALGPSETLRLFQMLRDRGFGSETPPLRAAIAAVTAERYQLASEPSPNQRRRVGGSQTGGKAPLTVSNRIGLMCELIRLGGLRLDGGGRDMAAVGDAVVAWLVRRLCDTPSSEFFFPVHGGDVREEEGGSGAGCLLHELVGLVSELAVGRDRWEGLDTVVEQVYSALRVGLLPHLDTLPLRQAASGAVVLSISASASTLQEESRTVARLLGSVLARRLPELYTSPVDDVVSVLHEMSRLPGGLVAAPGTPNLLAGAVAAVAWRLDEASGTALVRLARMLRSQPHDKSLANELSRCLAAKIHTLAPDELVLLSELISSRDSGLKPSASKPLIKALSEGLCKVMDRLTASQVTSVMSGWVQRLAPRMDQAVREQVQARPDEFQISELLNIAFVIQGLRRSHIFDPGHMDCVVGVLLSRASDMESGMTLEELQVAASILQRCGRVEDVRAIQAYFVRAVQNRQQLHDERPPSLSRNGGGGRRGKEGGSLRTKTQTKEGGIKNEEAQW